MKFKKPAFTIVETLAAITVMALVLTAVIGILSRILWIQKTSRVSHEFYNESRIVVQRIVKEIQDNTIDYDRYYENALASGKFDHISPACDADRNNPVHIEDSYPEMFYFNGISLGGKKPNGALDECTQAVFGDVQDTIFLINPSRNKKTTITVDAATKEIQIAKSIKMQKDSDPDIISFIGTTQWNSARGKCESASPTGFTAVGDITEKVCKDLYSRISISPANLEVVNHFFVVTPTADPYLSFARPSSYAHPKVLLNFELKLRNAEQFGFTSQPAPVLQLQTTASSRLYGSTR